MTDGQKAAAAWLQDNGWTVVMLDNGFTAVHGYEARRECCNTWEAVMFRPAADVVADKGWDCFKALEETARESYKGGD